MEPGKEQKPLLERLPLLIRAWSKAFYIAVKGQAREIVIALSNLIKSIGRLLLRGVRAAGRALLRAVKFLWAVYQRFETHFLQAAIDLGFALIALRFFFLIVLIAAALAYFRLWWGLIIYLAFLGIAIRRLFRAPVEPADEQSHNKLRLTLVRLLRWPLRGLATALMLLLTWLAGAAGLFEGNPISNAITGSELTNQAQGAVANPPTEQKSESQPMVPGDGPAASEPEPPATPTFDTIFVKNECPEKIFVAVHYFNENKQWMTRGWYVLESTEKERLPLESHSMDIFFYAESSERGVWSGNGMEGAIELPIVADAFKHVEGQSLKGNGLTRVWFIPVRTSETFGDVQQSFCSGEQGS